MNSNSNSRVRALDAFRKHFVRSPEFLVRAPGRVNLIGEHTDYSEGLALPCAIDRELFMAAARRDDDQFLAYALDLGIAGESATFAVSQRESTGGFADYLKGAVSALIEAKVSVSGLDLTIASDLPIGSGLSSSAALCVAACKAMLHAQGLSWEAKELARAAHRAESHFVGTQCGILDPFAIALGRTGHALRIDCRSQRVERVAFPASKLAILISSCGVRRKLAPGGGAQDAGSGYRERVAQCRAAFDAAKSATKDSSGARSLRDISLDALPDLETKMDALLFRRLRHVVSENARVDACVAALGRGTKSDFETVGELLRAGHRSLRDDFEVSIRELDALCEDADSTRGVYGSRLTGAGFGGSTLHLVDPLAVENAREEIAARFDQRFGRRPEILVAHASSGASIESI